MNAHPEWVTEMRGLLDDLQDGLFDESDSLRLNELLHAGPAQREFYITYMDIHSRLAWDGGRGRDQRRGARGEGFEFMDAAESPLAIPPLSTLHSPLSTTFVGGPVFSYMVATVVLCLMLLGAWAYKITHDRNVVATNSRRSTTSGQSELVFVGRITGIKDCRWADPDTQTIIGASVPLDRKYALASGLMEITYTSGARVILEGPCTYKVESSAGGFLARGKLTAKISSQPSAVSGQKSEPSSLSSLPSPLFAVRTPTAKIIDLGTEFGVEVDENGDTASYVFEGKIVVKSGIRGFGDSGIRDVQLAAGESVRVSRVCAGTHHDSTAETVSFTQPTTPPKFVRQIPQPLGKLDLLDVVAGGNGWGWRRECGIDAASGDVDFEFAEKVREGNNQYSLVVWSKLIDGVFIPDGRSGAVWLDSAGHVFDGFSHTSNITYGSLFARAAKIDPNKTESELEHWVYRIGRCRQFMPEDRGLLTFCPNVGITFDLEAVRANNPGQMPARLRATIGMGDVRPYYPTAGNLADFWVFVDGRLKFKRERLCPKDGAVDIDVVIGPKDRFLTLVSTNAGDSTTCDWVVVGDPAVQMIPNNTEKK
ncbi:MAG: NPCBM/NEW2 domain-containing protein [Pirellulales bacterium]|nr:NPCBM/NEW2 domain-containing protein [Pirellulales bacterium]